LQQHGDVRLGTQGIRVILPGLLRLQRLQVRLNLSLDFLERALYLRSQSKVVSSYFSVARRRDFGIDFLHTQLVGSQSPFLGFRFNQPLADEVVDRFTPDFVLLIPEWNDLRRHRVFEVALRNRLSRRDGHRCFDPAFRAIAV